MILPQDTDLNFASIAQLFSQADGPIVLVFFSAVVEIELLDDERVNSDTSCTRYSSDIIPLNGLDAELIIIVVIIITMQTHTHIYIYTLYYA